MYWSLAAWLSLLLVGMASILLKPYLSYVNREYFAYENAWDEASYLSYQGALAMEGHGLRWVSGSLVRIGHELGLSGAVQNLILDIATPVVVCTTIVVVTLSFPRMRAAGGLRMAWFGGFGTVLFNQANPLLLNVFPNLRYEETVWAVAWESYLPILRSPEPQVSLLLSAAAVIAFFRHGRLWWTLLLPMPFLYFPVAVFYGYLAGAYLFWLALGRIRPWGEESLTRLMVANAGVFLSLATSIFALGLTGMLDAGIPLKIARFSHEPRISPLLIWTVVSLALAWLVVVRQTSAEDRVLWRAASVTAAGVQLFITNQQVISGTEIHPQGLQAVAGTGTAAFALCLLAEALVRQSQSTFYRLGIVACGAVVSVWILVSLHVAQGLDLANSRYLIFINHDITRDEFNSLRTNPLKAIVPSKLLASHIVLALPRQIAPPFAYQYAYPWFSEVCADATPSIADAWRFVKQNRVHPLLIDYLPELDRDMAGTAEMHVQDAHLGRRCGKAESPDEDPFTIIPCRSGIHYTLWRK